MPRFKNPHQVPKVVGDGIPVDPGGFVVIDDPDDSVYRDLVQVPDEQTEEPTTTGVTPPADETAETALAAAANADAAPDPAAEAAATAPEPAAPKTTRRRSSRPKESAT